MPSVSLHNREIGKGVAGIVDAEEMAEYRRSSPVFGSQDWATGSTNSGVRAAPCPLDHVNLQFHAPAPNILWVSDFTYVATWTGFVHVAFVIDTYARRIVG